MQSMTITSIAMLSGVKLLDVSGGAVSHGGSTYGSHAHACAVLSNGCIITMQSASFV